MPKPQPILIPVSVGELIDRLTILELKCHHLTGAALEHVQHEQALLAQALEQTAAPVDPNARLALAAINAQLWQVEDALRLHEQRQELGTTFVELARSVYRLNDERHRLKRAIDLAAGSDLISEKSYAG